MTHEARTVIAMTDSISAIEAIDRCLPQTQCTQCGYSGCKPYAQAIVLENEAINRCPPGGQAGVAALARLLNQAETALDTSRGLHKPRHIAKIDETACIGCTLCIKACPVGAIVGANKQLHYVITADCTGCDLCLPPCPVDCIEMVIDPQHSEWTAAQANRARVQHQAFLARQAANVMQPAYREDASNTGNEAHTDKVMPQLNKAELLQAAIEAASQRRRA